MSTEFTQSSSDSRNDSKALTSSIQSPPSNEGGIAGNSDVTELLRLQLSPLATVRVSATGDRSDLSRPKKGSPVYLTGFGAHSAAGSAADASVRGPQLDSAADVSVQPASDDGPPVAKEGVEPDDDLLLIVGYISPFDVRPKVDFNGAKDLVKNMLNINPKERLTPFQDLRDEYLVAGTDGVGTKLKLTFETGQSVNERSVSDPLRQVAMSVDDIVTSDAKPLFFLDYYATSKLDVDLAEKVIKGIVDGWQQSVCTVLGGEVRYSAIMHKFINSEST
ncbi:phosphoribosylformylglycinamidine cyclo-ligase, chloroplastic/mitochondrial-like [Hordeum vulgare]|nr:phosphoribosylformylglycinamidine cyclo-ligase, chloroplastic/mitochondrial-like [Hordeum vulgare]